MGKKLFGIIEKKHNESITTIQNKLIKNNSCVLYSG